MRKEWLKPELEVLEVSETMFGYPDQVKDYEDVNGTEVLTGPS